MKVIKARYAAMTDQEFRSVRRDWMGSAYECYDQEDPEPKPRFYMRASLVLACVMTAIVLGVAVIRSRRGLPLETQPLVIVGGVWSSAFISYVPHLRARFEWRDRRRKQGLL